MNSPISERFMLIEESQRPGPYQFSHDVLDLSSARTADHDLQYMKSLREAYPEMIVTGIPTFNIPLINFANAGFATYAVDKDTETYFNWRGYTGPSLSARGGSLAEIVHFAKFRYEWAGENFILYTVGPQLQYVLKEKKDGESQLGPSKVVDSLVKAVGAWLLNDIVWVFDRYWYQDKALFQQVKKMSWDKVILDESVKKELTEVATTFFDSKDVYDDLGVPWKRGLMFYGPPGNGKTISIKALMHTLLFNRGKRPIPTLYVKAAPQTYDINSVFRQARALSPCMLILEDIETIVTPQTRSYFFNQLDGLESNDGLFVVGSTNYLDRLDPGLTKRPSRFDRKYLFPLPNEHERELYCQFWRHKTAHKKDLEFPEKLCPAMAKITPGFSFAFLQECFVATLLVLAHQTDVNGDDDNLEKYELWRVFKQQADVLRKEIGTERRLADSTSQGSGSGSGAGADQLPAGWERLHTPDGQAYFADHNTRTTTWAGPKQPQGTAALGDLGGLAGPETFGGMRLQDRLLNAEQQATPEIPGGNKFNLVNSAAMQLTR